MFIDRVPGILDGTYDSVSGSVKTVDEVIPELVSSVNFLIYHFSDMVFTNSLRFLRKLGKSSFYCM